jgi:hypothetical protein
MPVNDDAAYQSAWNEAMRRVIVRDTALLGYVGAAGTLLVASQTKPDLALGVPFVTLILGCVIAHHDFMIASLNGYLRRFQSSGNTELWHSVNLRKSVLVGLLLYTIPSIVVFGAYSCIARDVARQVLPDAPAHKLLVWQTPLSAAGIAALFAGRVRQLLALPMRFPFGK